MATTLKIDHKNRVVSIDLAKATKAEKEEASFLGQSGYTVKKISKARQEKATGRADDRKAKDIEKLISKELKPIYDKVKATKGFIAAKAWWVANEKNEYPDLVSKYNEEIDKLGYVVANTNYKAAVKKAIEEKKKAEAEAKAKAEAAK